MNDLQKAFQPCHIHKKTSIISEASTIDSVEITTPQITPISYELDCVYMIADSCFDFVARMKLLPQEKDDFVSLCQEALQGNNALLPIIQEFQENYSAGQAISWLHRHFFFLQFLDAIFQTGAIDSMFPCRVFIHDIQKQLEKHKCTSTIQVFRSEPMLDEQLQKLKSFNGKIIAMKSFYITNSNREKALSCTADFSSSVEYKRVLFIIEANPQIENIKSFANIGSIGYNNDPDDFLFMIGSPFKITGIEDEKDGITTINMTLCASDDTNTLKAPFDQVKSQYIDDKGETDVIGFGQFLLDIGNSICDSNLLSSGEKLIHSCLGKLPNDHLDHSRCYDALGNIALIKEDLDSSLNWYKKSFDMKKGKLEITDPNLAESYKNLASVYLEKRDLIEALECFKQLSIIWKQSYGDDCFNLAFCYTNMAMIYESEGHPTDAISYYYRALAVMVKHPSVNSASFATLYNNLGNMYTELQNYHLALGFYNTSLEIKLKIHTPIHPSIATTYKNIGLVHGYMNNIQLSRENLEHAATIYREVHPADHINVTEIEELIANLPKNDQN